MADIAAELGIGFSTVTSYLEEAILFGLPINFTRLGLTMEAIENLEKVIREPPVNSSQLNNNSTASNKNV